MTMLSPSPPPSSPSPIPDMRESSKAASSKYSKDIHVSQGLSNPPSKPRGNKILSQKVARALQVKTDTPAMTAALKAISNLTSSSVSNSCDNKKVVDDSKQRNSNNKVIDARSVRAAIEQDALQQAILFQSELNNLLETVTKLKKSVVDIRIAASQVNNAIEASAVCTPLDLDFDKNIDLATESNDGEISKNNYDGSNDTFLENSNEDIRTNERNELKDDKQNPNIAVANNDNSGLKKEQNLAFVIADAFRVRNEAAYRAKTVQTFLEKFDLSESDNYLLDHYSFQDIDPMNPNMSKSTQNHLNHHPNREAKSSSVDKSENYELSGDAFIQALKRVRSIREQLKSTFDTETYIHNHHDTNLDEETNISYPNKGSLHANYDSRLGATSALRMMESLATKQERAYERLYNWLQTFLHLNDTSNEHIPTSSSALTLQGRRKDTLKRQQSSNVENGEDDDLMDESFSHPFVKSSLIMLKYVPAYYDHILELISTQRRSEVTRRFLLALTSGYNGITPIEMKAHDPVNYIGDMLAFIFRSFSVELELSRGLFSSSSSNSFDDDDDSNKIHSSNEINKQNENDHLYEKDGDDLGNNSETTMTPSLLLSHAMSGVTRPLKSRISQVITSLARRADDNDKYDDSSDIHQLKLRSGGHNDDNRDLDTDLDEEAVSFRNRIAALYSICGLFLFYHGALQKSKAKIWDNEVNMSNDESNAYTVKQLDLPLIEAIQSCLEEASTAYGASIRVYAAMLSSFAALTSKESESTLTHTLIAQISDVYVKSPGFADKLMLDSDLYSQVNRTLSLEFLCDTLLDSAILSCYSLDDAQSLKSAVTIAKKSGLSVKCVEKWEKLLIEIESKVIDELIQIETDDYLDECGLGSVWKAFQRVEKMLDNEDDDVVITTQFSTQPDLTAEILESAIKTFYSSLYKPPLPSFNSIKDLEGRNAARSKTSSNIATIYRRFYEGVKSEKGGYKDLSFLCHHPDKVQVLLSV